MKSICAAFLIICFALNCASAEIVPNSLFSDNAVLQRGIAVPVWGMGTDGERVSVSINGQKATAVVKDGKWMVKLKPLQAGGPYVLTINDLRIINVLVGEVWVAGGQSNMQWTLAQTNNAEKDTAAATDPNLRLFNVPRVLADERVGSVKAEWAESNPSTSAAFSAVAYFFGNKLRKELGVPVGLINVSWGGTPAQAWTPKEYLDSDPLLRPYLTKDPSKGKDSNKAAILYDSLVYPIQPFAIKGAIWYQGESNSSEADKYRTLFPAMIRAWRETWGQGDFPFYFVQLAPFGKILDRPEESRWAELREAQLFTSKSVVNTGMAVITDFGDPDDIHPKDKRPVGERLAYLALNRTYSRTMPDSGPLFKNLLIKGDRAILSFDYAQNGLEAKDGDLKGFTIAGADKVFYNAGASIYGDKVVVSAPEVKEPVAVRYGWANCPVVNLFNKAGLPASPFRTDESITTTGR